MSLPQLSPTAVEQREFSQPERILLLQLAHDAIISTLEEREISSDPPVSSVYRAVIDTARAAAFEDTRFYPVTIDEARHLEIELSILSPPKPISADEVEVGRHGLLISLGGNRGLLLPQVPTERNWDRITFLEQTCRKAGLAPDAWKHGALIEAFTAEVFGEK